LIRTRLHTIRDFSTKGRPYFADEFPFEEKALKKNLKKDENLKTYLPELADMLDKLETFDLEKYGEHRTGDM